MKIEKLPSGNYRIRQQVDGQRVSITLPYKPSKKEAVELLDDKRHGRNSSKMTFFEAGRKYIDGKQHTLSPSTVRGYESILKAIPDSFKERQLSDISAWDVQVYIDGLSEHRTPKTVHNYHGFISAVLATFAPETILRTHLPQKVENVKYLPSDEDIKRILDMSRGTVYEIPVRLACYGLRRSEICALTVEDLNGSALTISKALVADKDMKWVVKTTKTTAGTRTIQIDDDLADLIRATGYIYKGYPNRIYWHLQRCQDKLGIPNFPLHYMRHYYASTMHELGVPDEEIMQSGGWKTDHVMKRVYRHAKDPGKHQQAMIDHLNNL